MTINVKYVPTHLNVAQRALYGLTGRIKRLGLVDWLLIVFTLVFITICVIDMMLVRTFLNAVFHGL